jgi:hypothetical protein
MNVSKRTAHIATILVLFIWGVACLYVAYRATTTHETLVHFLKINGFSLATISFLALFPISMIES